MEDSTATTSFLSFFNAIFHLEIDQFHSITMYCCRFIYWNSHFYGSNFYGWSIGDIKSLSESGPFHSQGDYDYADRSKLWSYNSVMEASCGIISKCVEANDCVWAVSWL